MCLLYVTGACYVSWLGAAEGFAKAVDRCPGFG
jgi:hypothetical protein